VLIVSYSFVRVHVHDDKMFHEYNCSDDDDDDELDFVPILASS
jgi:hypothetical protein